MGSRPAAWTDVKSRSLIFKRENYHEAEDSRWKTETFTNGLDVRLQQGCTDQKKFSEY